MLSVSSQFARPSEPLFAGRYLPTLHIYNELLYQLGSNLDLPFVLLTPITVGRWQKRRAPLVVVPLKLVRVVYHKRKEIANRSMTHPNRSCSGTLRHTHLRRKRDRQSTQHNRPHRPSMGGTRKMGGGPADPQL